jgi:hypothetical protein
MNQAIINHIKFALHNMAFLDIKKALSGKSKMGTFILASCFIDYMAGFVCGRETKSKDYQDFVRDYMPSIYDPLKLYKDLRCKLVHNYSEGGSYVFTDGKPQLHGQTANCRNIINLENFIDDLENALHKLLKEIESNPSKQQKAFDRYKSIGLLNIGKVTKGNAQDFTLGKR